MNLVNYMAEINGLIFGSVVCFHMTRSLIGGNGYADAVKLLVTLSACYGLSKIVLQSVSNSELTKASCVEFEHWTECGGFFFKLDGFAYVAEKAIDLFGDGAGVPASSAAVLSAWFLHSRLISGFSMTVNDLIRSFAGAMLIYVCCLKMGDLQAGINNMVVSVTAFGGGAEAGKASLIAWQEASEIYVDVTSEGSFFLNVIPIVFILFNNSLPFFAIDAVNIICFLLQNILLAMVPLSMFLTSIRRDADPLYVVKLASQYAILGAIPGFWWGLCSLFPSDYDTSASFLNVSKAALESFLRGSASALVTLAFGLAVLFFVAFPTIKMIFMGAKGLGR